MATAKKNTSASSHQRDLARMSGNTAAKKKATEMRKAGNRHGVLDATGSAAVRAERRALKSFGLKTEPGKTTKKAPAKPSTVQQIAKRFNVTAREARDIATAVANVGALAFDKNVYANSSYINKKMNTTKAGEVKKAIKDVGTQIKETGRAAATGKKGTTAGRKGLPVGEYPYEYFKGTKRK
jgi:hypothetical protein